MLRTHSQLWLSLYFCLLLAACVSTTEDSKPYAEYGMQANQQGFVPARIAILPCQAWPRAASFKNLALSSAKPEELDTFCQELDKRVVDGFRGQAFMQGYSPKFVQKSLQQADQAALLGQIPQLWSVNGEGDSQKCLSCPSAPAYYAKSIAPNPAWQLWLQTLSQNVNHADAALLPFVTYAYSRSLQDRGLDISERAQGINLLLISTASGELLWAGGREAIVPIKQLHRPGSSFPPPPAWDVIYERLYTNALWNGFPGRQVYE